MKDKLQAHTMRLRVELMKRLKIQAIIEDTSIQQSVSDAIELWLDSAESRELAKNSPLQEEDKTKPKKERKSKSSKEEIERAVAMVVAGRDKKEVSEETGVQLQTINRGVKRLQS